MVVPSKPCSLNSLMAELKIFSRVSRFLRSLRVVKSPYTSVWIHRKNLDFMHLAPFPDRCLIRHYTIICSLERIHLNEWRQNDEKRDRLLRIANVYLYTIMNNYDIVPGFLSVEWRSVR